ncbi:MAG: MarR family transcriptional regulator [Candidatus Dormibacteraeota bacterium]|nr:MarR family transcriptional regulator [Candidatus Dormibacteraeota bacterium]
METWNGRSSCRFASWGLAMDGLRSAVAGSLRVSRRQMQAVDILLRRGSVSVGELAQALTISTGATTSLVGGLVRLGHVRRVRDRHDRPRVAFGELGGSLECDLGGYEIAHLRQLEEFLPRLRPARADVLRPLAAPPTRVPGSGRAIDLIPH